MQELTMQQMSVRGGEWSLGHFFDGFLCGVFVVGAIAITPTISIGARMIIYGGLIAACGSAFLA